MSASLVGSEMCIRDRTTADLVAARVLRTYSRRRSPSVARPAQEAASSGPCLLYTSDAADDM
eukprot:10369324-Alexandrium_andersonii.AAC.1